MSQIVLQASGLLVDSSEHITLDAEKQISIAAGPTVTLTSDQTIDVFSKDFVTLTAVNGSGTGRVSLLADGPIVLRAFGGSGTLEYVAGQGWTFDGKTMHDIVREELCKIIHCD